MPFELLDPHKEKHHRRWLDVLADMKVPAARDVHLSPWYLAAESHIGHAAPRLAVYQRGGYSAVRPIVIRDVIVGGRNYGMDVTSPHGYGGPACDGGPAFFEEADDEFQAWCCAANVICEYTALNPMHLSHQLGLMAGWRWPIQERKPVVWMDVAEDRSQSYHAARKAGLKAARKGNVGVILCVERNDLFVQMYSTAMARKNAADRWRLPHPYLNAMCAGGTVFYATLPKIDVAHVESAALVLSGGDVAYYHMAANLLAHPKAGANDLIVHEVTEWCRSHGIRRLHLGGGVTSAGDDPVLFFKSGFSDLRAPAMSTFRIFNQSAYREACAAKIAQEIDETGAELETQFQPMYRREAA